MCNLNRIFKEQNRLKLELHTVSNNHINLPYMTTSSKLQQSYLWKPIKGFDSYKISTNGEIKRIEILATPGKGNYAKPEITVKTQISIWGYEVVMLYKNKKQRNLPVHRLVALTFIPNPENKNTVNHINGIKTDNRVENLEWATHSENTLHACQTGLIKPLKGEKNGSSKITAKEVKHILKNPENLTQLQLAEKFNISRAGVSAIITRRNWKHITL